MDTTSQCPSWAHRKQPDSIGELLTWLEKAAAPHLAIIATDRCIVLGAINTGQADPNPAYSVEQIEHESHVLWDETTRACDWLAHFGFSDAPSLPKETSDPHEAQRLFREVQRYLRGKIKTPKRNRRQATKARKPRRLTPRQAEVVQIVGECKGNIAEAARRLGLDRKTVDESFKAGLAKLGKEAVRSCDKTRLFVRDRRGQEIVSESDDRRY